jgi:SH3-like domain-containing protein
VKTLASYVVVYVAVILTCSCIAVAEDDQHVKNAEAKQYIKSGNFAQCYFASIKVNEANLHNGPGKQYKIRCKYIKKGLPLLVTAQYEHWRKVKDSEGTEGWMHKNLLSNIRHVIVTSNTTGFTESPGDNAKSLAILKKNIVAKLLSVNKNWCNISLKYNKRTYVGWVKKEDVFGVGKNESW